MAHNRKSGPDGASVRKATGLSKAVAGRWTRSTGFYDTKRAPQSQIPAGRRPCQDSV